MIRHRYSEDAASSAVTAGAGATNLTRFHSGDSRCISSGFASSNCLDSAKCSTIVYTHVWVVTNPCSGRSNLGSNSSCCISAIAFATDNSTLLNWFIVLTRSTGQL